MNKEPVPTIQSLYHHFNEKELAEAEDNIDRYLALLLRIFERLESEADPQTGRLTGFPSTLGSNSPEASG